MSVYRESARHLVPRSFTFRRRGGILPVVLAVIVIAVFTMVRGRRVHVACSRAADRCTYETFGVGNGAGSVSLSTVGALLVEHDGRGVSRLAFATTSGDVALGSVWDSFDEHEKNALATRFDTWRVRRDESFDDGYGPSPGLVAFILLGLAGAALWVARGGPAARVLVDPQAETVTVELRPHPWVGRDTRTLSKARLREWKGSIELYDESGLVVPLPVALRESRGRALEAALARD